MARPGATGADNFWFADYMADLDFLAGPLRARQPVNLVGHSMGGNVVMLYAVYAPSASAA
jgi:alpha-beta hydrolase superfamily lysophospholipase